MHPADLDDALCVGTLGAQGGEGEGGTRLPFAVDEALLQCTTGDLWAVRSCSHQTLSNAQCLITLALCSLVGRPWRAKERRRSRCGLGLHRDTRKRSSTASSRVHYEPRRQRNAISTRQSGARSTWRRRKAVRRS